MKTQGHTQLEALGTTGLQTWIQGNVIPLVLLGIAVVMLFLSGSGNLAKLFKIAAGTLIALAVLGVALSGSGVDIGKALANLFS